MSIKRIFAAQTPVLSFEIFPPKPDYPVETIFQTIEGLQDLQPDFISVTYGAGGSNRARTIEIASHIKKNYGIESMAHLTCVGHSPADLDGIIDELKKEQIENILALRGDPPQNEPDFTFKPGYYRTATELIKHIRSRGEFSIGATAYPEGHKECRRWQDDWAYLKEKVDTGVDFLITQLFFDNRIFYNFLDNIQRLGVKIPVSAGIMPVLNSTQIKRMVYLSEASIPCQLLKLFDKFGNNNEEFTKAGIDYVIDQIEDLLENKVDGIHFYTMNKVIETKLIINSLNFRGPLR